MDPSFLLNNDYVLCEEDDFPDDVFEYDGGVFEYGTMAPNGGALSLDVRGTDGRWYSRCMEGEPGWKYTLDDVDLAMEELVTAYRSSSKSKHQ
jgi:hypothetical protein